MLGWVAIHREATTVATHAARAATGMRRHVAGMGWYGMLLDWDAPLGCLPLGYATHHKSGNHANALRAKAFALPCTTCQPHVPARMCQPIYRNETRDARNKANNNAHVRPERGSEAGREGQRSGKGDQRSGAGLT